MAITLQDVAEAAGVSRSTASRALSGSPLISATTQAAVAAAAQKLGYQPNLVASALRSRHTHLIGLVLNNLINATFHTVAEVAQKRAHEKGYQLVLTITDADPAREKELLTTLAAHHVDGLVVIGTGQNVAEMNRMIADGTPIVNVIRGPGGSRAPAVMAADREGALDATRHLLGLGHTRIAYIGGPSTANSGVDRFDGYAQALADAGLVVDESLVVRGPFEPAFGTEAVAEVLDRRQPPTALYIANHEAAFGALPALAGRGVRIPADLSLVCHEDIPWLQTWSPPVTVVDNGAREIADTAMDILLGQLERGVPASARTYRVGAQLVVRGSTAAPPAPPRRR